MERRVATQRRAVLSPSAVRGWFSVRHLRDAADCVEELLKVVLEWPGYAGCSEMDYGVTHTLLSSIY